jgi:hypothetical protein
MKNIYHNIQITHIADSRIRYVLRESKRPLAMSAATPATSMAPVTPSFLAPPAVYNAIVAAGETKAKLPWWKTLYLGILAGAYIGFGCALALSVGGAVPGIVSAGALGVQRILFGAFGLPFGW